MPTLRPSAFDVRLLGYSWGAAQTGSFVVVPRDVSTGLAAGVRPPTFVTDLVIDVSG